MSEEDHEQGKAIFGVILLIGCCLYYFYRLVQ